MGFLRFWLALAVYVQHLGVRGWSPSYYPINGHVAVNAFFIVSGFLMQFIIRRNYGNPLAFWKSRFYRIYPVYWLVLASSVLFVACNQYHQEPRYYRTDLSLDHPTPYPQWHFQLIGEDPVLSDKLMYVGTQLSILGLYKFSDYGYIPTLHRFIANQYHADVFLNGINFPIIPQAWSLDIELWFYLLAPFLLTRHLAIVLLAFVFSLTPDLFTGTLRSLYFGVSVCPFLYLFLAGAMACRFYLRFLHASPNPHTRLTLLFIGLIILLSCRFNCCSLPDSTKESVFYALIVVALPFLFRCTKDNRFDRFIGELSYPIYLWHIVARALSIAMFSGYSGYVSWDMMAVVTLLLSCLTIFCIERPLDRYRHKRFRQAAATDAVPQSGTEARLTYSSCTQEPVCVQSGVSP